MTTNNGYILALDVGDKRIGVAIASPIAKLARPHSVLLQDDHIWENLQNLVSNENVGVIVVGLPRSLRGEDTAQTRSAREFAAALSEKLGLLVTLQDEALTSRQAEAELRAGGKHFAKGDIDALAATYILEDYLARPDNIDTMRVSDE